MPPPENTSAIEAFLKHWKPDAVLWADGPLRPALLHMMADDGMPMTLINLSRTTIETRPAKWPLGLRKSTMRLFEKILCVDKATRDAVVRLGTSADKVEAAGMLSNSPMAIPCDESRLSELRDVVGNRPLWLAVDMTSEMFDGIQQAHRAASRISHRLTLLCHPQKTDRAEDLAHQFRGAGWQTAQLSKNDRVSSQTQVIITDRPGDLGLTLRISPLTVMASTFDNSDVTISPLDAALLGTAILHGPNLGAMRADYGPLMAGDATQMVRSGVDLPAALSQALAPDASARLAHAAWDISTRGAPVMERVIELANHQLDAREVA
nr:glycosyltransferase N-terminal domain-containing protein [Nereida sp. MMG025]